MPSDVIRLDLRLRRRGLIGYCLGMAAYTLAVVALYPAFKTSTSLDKLIASDPTAAALFGISGPISTSGGWLNGNIYANFMPLIMLLLTIGYGATCLAGQDEDGTLALVAVLPVRRASVLLQKASAMAVQAVLLSAAVAVCVVIGRGFQLTVGIGDTVGISVALVLMGLDFGLIAMAVGAATGRRGVTLGVASGLAAASYLLGSLATAISAIRPLRYVSLFYWSVGNDQITEGVSIADFAVLIGVGVAALCTAAAAFDRADLS